MTATDARQVVADVHRKAPRSGSGTGFSTVADESPSSPTPTAAQALLQLADNAVKHTRSGDQIRIGAGEVDGSPRLWVTTKAPASS
jgi:signal transduction histidine kinase